MHITIYSFRSKSQAEKVAKILPRVFAGRIESIVNFSQLHRNLDNNHNHTSCHELFIEVDRWEDGAMLAAEMTGWVRGYLYAKKH